MTMLPDEHTSILAYMYSGDSYQCHSLRLLLAEKQIHYKPVMVEDPRKPPEDLLDANGILPSELPTLVDRQLCITDSQIMCEYLDERFPYPPLMPVDPAARARTRQSLTHIRYYWWNLMDEIYKAKKAAKAKAARAALLEEIEAGMILFDRNHMKNDEFSLLDCVIAPILWRLPSVNVELDGQSFKPICLYQKRMFSSSRFRNSMIEADRSLNGV